MTAVQVNPTVAKVCSQGSTIMLLSQQRTVMDSSHYGDTVEHFKLAEPAESLPPAGYWSASSVKLHELWTCSQSTSAPTGTCSYRRYVDVLKLTAGSCRSQWRNLVSEGSSLTSVCAVNSTSSSCTSSACSVHSTDPFSKDAHITHHLCNQTPHAPVTAAPSPPRTN